MERTVLITGCSSGIGRATARAFYDEEWTVYATARDTDDVQDLADLGCEVAELDVTKPAQCQNVVEQVIDEQGRLDCLVNNAGYGQLGAVEDVPTRRVHRQFDVNVYGPHRLIRAALPHMREREDGTIVNLSSVVGQISVPGMGIYSGSKFALEALSDALRSEVSSYGIDVCLVEPGPVETGFEERVQAEIEEVDTTGAYEKIYEIYEDASHLSGVGSNTPGEVAAVILNAASSTAPAPRYAVGPIGTFGSWFRHLPDRWRDAGYRLLSKLP